MNTTTEVVVIAIVVLLVVVVIAGALYARRRRTHHLQARFGPEYARAIEESGGGPSKGELALEQREKRVKRYRLQPLSGEDRRRFGVEWDRVQALFVDSPTEATARADLLVGQVMTARGYPDGPFEQRLEDLSVEHAEAVQGYRVAHEVAFARAGGEATTEDRRQAMIDYRRLCNELLGEAETDQPPAEFEASAPASAGQDMPSAGEPDTETRAGRKADAVRIGP